MNIKAMLIVTFGLVSLLISFAECTLNKRKREKKTYQPCNP
jgi:hypothetical protein